MPTISRFYGILISMYFGDHPPPHFHARYGEHEVRDELLANWKRVEEKVQLTPIEPLP